MKFQELKNSIEEGAKKFYLIEGEDGYLREYSYTLLKNAFLHEPSLNLSCFEGDDVKSQPENLITAIESYPFMSEKRLVVVREYYPTAQDLKNKALFNSLSEILESTILIVINSSKSEQLKKLQSVTVVDCSKLDEIVIIKWLKNQAKKKNIEISTEACELLCNYTSLDMYKISSEFEKLYAYCLNEGKITAVAVEKTVTKDTDYQIYELSENIANSKYDIAYENLKTMLEKNRDKQMLFMSIYYHFRRLFYVSISKGTDAELAESLGVKEYAIKRARVQAKKFSQKRLMAIVEKLSNYDTQFKSGKISVTDALLNAIFNIIIGG